MAPPTGDKVVTQFASQIQGKTIVITGPSQGGIGAQIAFELAAANPKAIILAGRSKDKVQPVIDQIKAQHPHAPVSFVALDLASLASVRAAAKEIDASIDKLDILINNAGIMALEKYTLSQDGIEMQFASNHVGHFLLTKLLFHKILAAGKGARVLNISSGGYINGGVREDYNFKSGDYNPWHAYGQSKTANILFSSALARKFRDQGVVSFGVNPGFVPTTNLQNAVTRESFANGFEIATKALNGAVISMEPITTQESAGGVLIAALDPTFTAHNGAYVSDGAVTSLILDHAVGEANEERLWSISEDLIGEKFIS